MAIGHSSQSHQYIKDWKVEICSGGVDRQSKQRGSTVNTKAINTVGPGGDQQLMRRGSTVNFHFRVKRQSPLLILGGGGWSRLMINMERIKSM